MSTLTNKERDALEDVFLSIHSSGRNYLNIKDIYTKVVTNEISVNLSNLLKQAKIGVKKGKIPAIKSLFSKKKKTLS